MNLQPQRNGAFVAATAAVVAGLIGYGSSGGTAALASDSGARGQLSGAAPPLAPLPAGNGAQAFAFDPRRPNVVYAASAHARGGVYVFKTTDGGQHWRSTRAQGAGWQSDILSLTADPRRAGTLYAGTDTAVYKTVDGGRSWRPFNRGLFPRPHKVCSNGQCWKYPYYGTPGKTNWNRDNGWVLDVAVDPNDRSVVYAAAGGVRKSTDGGHTWKSMLKPQSKWMSVTRVAIAPTRPESIYAITHNIRGSTAIYKSTNAGRTWQRTGGSDSGLPPSCCGDSMDSLASDPAYRQTLYAAVGQTVFVTTDGGAAWRPMANGLPGKAVTSLAADPRRPGTLYASVLIPHSNGDVETPTGGVYKTTDGGHAWTEIWSGFGVDKVAIDPARPSTIYGAGWAGRDPTHANEFRLLRSTDGGHTWIVAGSSNPSMNRGQGGTRQ